MSALIIKRVLLSLNIAVIVIFLPACSSSSVSGIEWKEPALEALVREKIGKSKGAISQSDLDDIWGIELFGDSHIFFNGDGGYEMYNNIDGYAKEDFSITEQIMNPDNIDLNRTDSERNPVCDGTYSVGEEQFTRGSISSMADFANFRNLKYLHIYKNNLDDLSGLTPLENLVNMILVENAIRDITGLAELKQISSLSLTANRIEDITPLKNLSQLRKLGLRENQISSLDALIPLHNLELLNLSYNPITDISELGKLVQLSSLYLANTSIDDISPLTDMTSLTALTISNLNAESVDLTPLATLEKLRYLAINQNRTELINFQVIADLKHLDLRLDITPSVNITNEDIAWLKKRLPQYLMIK